MDLLPMKQQMNAAQRLIKKFKHPGEGVLPSSPYDDSSGAQPMYSRSMSMAHRKRSLQDSLEVLGNEGGELNSRLTMRVDLNPWCHVFVDAVELKRMTRDTAEVLGIALTQALQKMRNKKGEGQ